jgi:hypothetical protein
MNGTYIQFYTHFNMLWNDSLLKSNALLVLVVETVKFGDRLGLLVGFVVEVMKMCSV